MAPAVGGDLPNVAPLILNHATSISVRRVEGRLDRTSARFERAFVYGFSVAYVDVEKGWYGAANAGLAHHNDASGSSDSGPTTTVTAIGRLYPSNLLPRPSAALIDGSRQQYSRVFACPGSVSMHVPLPTHSTTMHNHAWMSKVMAADAPSPTWVWKKAQDGVINYVHKKPA